MTSVTLEPEEWQRVLAIIATAPWNVANPLLMKIGDQLRAQQPAGARGLTDGVFNEARPPGNSGGVQ